MLRTDQGQTVRLEDYRPTDFAIHTVDMTVRLFEGRADIEAVLTMERREGVTATAPLELAGDELELTGLSMDGIPVPAGDHDVSPELLTIRNLPESGRFQLQIATLVRPEKNTKLMGLYRSNGVWCTQCEAEGFRRITYYLDRPDVLATFRVRIEADQTAAPVLLSNGNPVEHGALADGRHYAVWDDPFPKPSYLFALVAGDLDRLGDEFTTMSGRKVDLAIYTEKGLAPRAAYAMDALKRSMAWDERRFGLEYDLDVFSIVAISDFNMGAMENKGLNVFNHKYVLLDPDTATDADYAGVETVIAHEYFHNWTGNRITCRDWFQLCLKEGLTVFRDQEFTSDERSRTVKRIATVRGLKAHQFPEDQGPLQHPVRPREYREINNFYTSTVYDKGSELVRMIQTILGPDDFRRGMDLYFERHDGEAATIEDFLACFADASGRDLSQFSLWYEQAGTPTLTVGERYDADARRLTLSLKQELRSGAAHTGTRPMHIPVRFGLVGPNGRDMEAAARGGAEIEGDVIHLRSAEATIEFDEVGERPFVSILRDFSAPVSLRIEQKETDRLALARLDPNPFNRWRALSDLTGEALRSAARLAQGGEAVDLDPELVAALISTAEDEALEPALRAQALTLPSEADIARLLGDNVDPDAVHQARKAAMRIVGTAGRTVFADLRGRLEDAGPFSADAASAGARALRNVALEYVSAATGDVAIPAREFELARNMTDRLAAFAILSQEFTETPETKEALDVFFERYRGNSLVIDKWFAVQATAPMPSTLQTVVRLAGHPQFTLTNPNRARALIGSFAAGNQVAFNRADGKGYRWVAARLLDLDRLNPQIAARLATAFRSWRCFEPRRAENARATLAELSENKDLSKDLRDIVDRILS